jgi:hypothetical protein
MTDEIDELSTLDDWQEFFAPTGRLIVAFAKLEYAIALCLQRILGITREQIDLIEARFQSVDEMKELLKRSVKLMGGEADAALTKLLPLITHAINFRNQVMHGFWFSQQWSDLAPDRQATKLTFGKSCKLLLNAIKNETRAIVLITYHLIYWIDQFYGPKRLTRPPWPIES